MNNVFNLVNIFEVFYSRERLHSANGYLSPVNYELRHQAA